MGRRHNRRNDRNDRDVRRSSDKPDKPDKKTYVIGAVVSITGALVFDPDFQEVKGGEKLVATIQQTLVMDYGDGDKEYRNLSYQFEWWNPKDGKYPNYNADKVSEAQKGDVVTVTYDYATLNEYENKKGDLVSVIVINGMNIKNLKIFRQFNDDGKQSERRDRGHGDDRSRGGRRNKSHEPF